MSQISAKVGKLGYAFPLLYMDMVAFETPNRRASSAYDKSEFLTASSKFLPKLSLSMYKNITIQSCFKHNS